MIKLVQYQLSLDEEAELRTLSPIERYALFNFRYHRKTDNYYHIHFDQTSPINESLVNHGYVVRKKLPDGRISYNLTMKGARAISVPYGQL